jgi:Arc/MetJ family transcription regulator
MADESYTFQCVILYTLSGVDAVATNLAIDDELINQAKTVGHHKTKREAVTAALEKYVQWHKQQQILEHFGTIDFDPEYDYKKMRMLDKIEIDEPEDQA